MKERLNNLKEQKISNLKKLLELTKLQESNEKHLKAIEFRIQTQQNKDIDNAEMEVAKSKYGNEAKRKFDLDDRKLTDVEFRSAEGNIRKTKEEIDNLKLEAEILHIEEKYLFAELELLKLNSL